MRPLDQVIEKHPLPTWRPLGWAIMAFLTALAVWAWTAELDTVAMAMGEVKPQGEVKIIQHLEGGIVEAIEVGIGEEVQAGQPLIKLDVDSSFTNKEELLVRLDGLILKKIRLEAEINDTELVFPSDLAERRPGMARAEAQTHESRLESLVRELQVLARQEEQRQLEIDELTVERRMTDKDLALAQERWDTTKPLIDKKLVTRMEGLELEAQVQTLDGKREILAASLPRAKSALQEVKEKREAAQQNFRSEAANALADTQLEIARTVELVNRAEQEAGRLAIVSPIDGVVKSLYVNTIGGVVRPGEPILEIVPLRDNLVVEARLNPIDIGYVKRGMPASVKMMTYDFIRYGALDGTVINVGADIETDETTGEQYFAIIIETDKGYLEKEGTRYDIFAGMQTQVDIHLGTKTVIDFLIQPVLKMRLEAFRER